MVGRPTVCSKEDHLHMPYVIPSKRRILAAIAVAAGVLSAGAPAASATTASVCVAPKFSQPFLPWSDYAFYTLSPGGNMETGLPGWTLTGGARAVAGNESYYVGSRTDRMSLSLPAGAAAVSSPMCIDRTYPTFRFFARNLGASTSDLRVDVLWKESGFTRTYTAWLDRKAGSQWTPVRSLRLPSGALSTGTLEPVTFRFTAVGMGANWQVDDLYVDPYMRR